MQLNEKLVGKHQAKFWTFVIASSWKKVEDIAPVKYDSSKRLQSFDQKDRRKPKGRDSWKLKGRDSWKLKEE